MQFNANSDAPNIKISQYHEMQKEYEDHLEEEERARRILQASLATNLLIAHARTTQYFIIQETTVQSYHRQVTNEQLYQEMQNFQEDEESGEEEEKAVTAVSTLEVRRRWRRRLEHGD